MGRPKIGGFTVIVPDKDALPSVFRSNISTVVLTLSNMAINEPQKSWLGTTAYIAPIVPPFHFNLNLVNHMYRLQLDWTSNTSRQKNILPTNQKGYDTFETTVGKLSARRIQIYVVYFSVIIF